MTIEILVHFEGTKSSIAFDALPTYNTLRRAIASDITEGNPSFLVIGTTQRGTPIVISDQTSFIRALGPRTSMIVNVRIQPSEGELVQTTNPTALTTTSSSALSPSSRKNQQIAPNNNNNNMSLVPQSIGSNNLEVAVARPPQSHMSPYRGDSIATCQQIVDVAGDSRCCAFVTSSPSSASPKVWVGERQSGNIRIHDYFSGEVEQVIRPSSGTFQSGPHSGCLAIAFVPGFAAKTSGSNQHQKEDRVWAGFNSKDIRVYSVGNNGGDSNNKNNTNNNNQQGNLVAVLNEHSSSVTAIESSAGGPFAFSSSLDFTIIQWNVDSLSVARIFSRHRNGVRALAFSSTGVPSAFASSILFSGSDDRCLVAWNAQTGEVLAEGVNIHGSGIHALAVDAQMRVWTGCEDGSVKVWQLQKLMEPVPSTAVVSTRAGNNHNNININNNKSINTSTMSNNNQNGNSGSQQMMSLRFECVASFREHAAGVAFIKCFKARAISSSHDGTIAVYDAENLDPLGALPHPHDAPATCIALSTFTTVFKFWTGSSDRKFCRWSMEDPGMLNEMTQKDINQIQKIFGMVGENSNNNHNNISNEQNDAITLLRFTLDRTTEKTLIVAEEAKNRAELHLFFEKRLRSKYFVQQHVALAKFSEAALAIHKSYSSALLDVHVSSGLATQSALESSSSALALTAAELEMVAFQRDQQQMKSHQDREVNSDNVTALQRRIRDLENNLSFAREEIAKSTQENRENADRENRLQQAYDSAMERQKVLDAELAKARNEKANDVGNREKGQLLRDEQWRQQEFVLQEQIANQRNVVEDKDNQIRLLKMQLASQQQLTQAKESEINTMSKLTGEGQTAHDKAVAAEREKWSDKHRDLEQKVERTLRESAETQQLLLDENNRLRAELAQLDEELSNLHNQAATGKRNKDAKISELENLVLTFSQSADTVRSNWQRDTETLARDLNRAQETLTRADGYAVTVEREAAIDRAAMKSLEQQNGVLVSDNVKLRETLVTERASAAAQIEVLEKTVLQLRDDCNDAHNNYIAEQTTRLAIERRLASIERSYEELRRSVDDGAVAVTKAYELDTAALARKYGELETAANQATSQLQEDVASLKRQLEHVERLKLQAESDANHKANDLSHLSAECRDLKITLQNVQTAHRREAETLRMDLADLAHSCATEKNKADSEANRYESEIADLRLRNDEGIFQRRKLESDLSRVTSEAAAARTRSDVVSESERKLEEERNALVEENTALRAELASAETRSSLHTKKVLELENALVLASHEKTRQIGSTHSLIQARDEEIESLRKSLRIAEEQARESESRLVSTQSELISNEQRQHTLVEEIRRLHRQAEVELLRDRDEAVTMRRAADDRMHLQEHDFKRSIQNVTQAREDDRAVAHNREGELRAALNQSERQLLTVRSQLEALDDAAREWKDQATRARADAQDTDQRSNENAIADQQRIARLEAAVAKGAEVEHLLEEQAATYKIEAQRAREQNVLIAKEISHLREELRTASGTARRAQEDADVLRAENRRMQSQTLALREEQQTNSTQIAVKRLTLENEDLKLKLKSGSVNAPMTTNTSGGFARIQQLENENEILHNRVATLDNERNSAWKELQSLLDDHKILHRQFNELKQHQQQGNNNGSVNSPSSEIALLRQQYNKNNNNNNSSLPRSTNNNNNEVSTSTSTRGAALANHYSEMLNGAKEMLRLLQKSLSNNNSNNSYGALVDPLTVDQLKRWLNAATIRGEAVTQSLFTDDEKKKLLLM